ncbi:type 1 glutamine amidotransferase [Paractinoplanes globisporus]|uniref:Type 1 glutamine amidotransferase n=1 Tax=Paractinoplanes globisporus TaxID=113565 RepID=A0ABW6WC82_9ACTN|nr:type 1 glutamine amidotransferase [Actinoplanes globisporus]
MSTATTSEVLIVHHDHASPAGPVAERFAFHGYAVVDHLVVPASHFSHPGVLTDFPDFSGFSAVVVLGSPWSAYDHSLIGSWVVPEMAQLRRADAAGVPVLGICFGGQLLAAAHGGSVAASDAPEIGWADVASDDETLVPGGPWFQWHYDRWTLPPGAKELARNPAASQAFVLRRNLALQFHPELTAASLDGWLSNGGAAKAAERGIDVSLLRERTSVDGAGAIERAYALVDGFLRQI